MLLSLSDYDTPQSSKDSTSPMSETCKFRTGQLKFQDHKPNWACKIVESKLKK